MQSSVYEAVGCPSVRLSVCHSSSGRAAGGFAAERERLQQISIDSRYAAPALSGKCG